MQGMDTEAIDGKAILVCTPTEHLYSRGWLEILEWLSYRGRDYCCFNLRYDMQAIFAWMSADMQWKLARLNRWESSCKSVQIEWIPAKRCKIKIFGRMIRFYDIYQFFRMSLDAAAKKYLGVGKHDLGHIDIANLQNHWHIERDREEVVKYCKIDAKRCEQLSDLLESGLKKVDAKFADPISSASLAARFFLRKKRIKLDRFVNAVFKNCYFGGRSECFRRGTMRNICAYDINSAYPYQAAKLPDFERLELVCGKEPHSDAQLASYYCKIRANNEHFGPVPVRSNGGELYYPIGQFWAWIDLYTYQALMHENMIADCQEAYEYHLAPKYSDPGLLFPKIPEFYALRKNSIELNIAIKLLLNGLYGKTAQINKRWVLVEDILGADVIENGYYLHKEESPGWYQNFAIASHITGGARMQLYTELRKSKNPENIVLVATDSIYTCENNSLDIKCSDDLGDWDQENYDEMLAIGCGVYWLRNGEKTKSKVRGFRTKYDLQNSLQSSRNKYKIKIESQLPLSMLWALKNDSPINKIATFPREMDLNFDKKRVWKPKRMTRKQFLNSSNGSEPFWLVFK